MPSPGSTIVFGAASKGIIKRDQQNNAVVYKTYYAAANPFQQMDTNDLETYKKEVAQKQIKEQGKLSSTQSQNATRNSHLYFQSHNPNLANRKNELHKELLSIYYKQ